ncbi:hypothetical protein J2Z21_006912 [Streptomyces griseochromogenes]|uniref:Uncharacterized protein n=1 Tax=Streptomyces griseochromogenes TaxID=68214 RepID=A0A1B1B316_9ACTN|nr:hypothetical protein [Streptomyces griseochromogenes]ANP53210.1 hypothetical protein AVL59_30030 [Streptomyces griseochromogenes]MBP2053910.1 hypothetical protein [Streptomyces griseochromogenes]
MSDGGAGNEGTAGQPRAGEEGGRADAGQEGAESRPEGAVPEEDGHGGAVADDRFARLRKHPVLASAVALALVAGAVAVPLALFGGDDSCKELPSAARALAKNPAAATRALDPGDDMSHLETARALLPSGTLCGDGGRVLGQVVDAATRATAPGRPHTTAQARAVYVVAVAYDDRDVPPGMEPGLARMFAGYVADANPFSGMDDDVNTPAVSGESAHGRFRDSHEAHPAFGFSYSGALSTDPGRLFQRLAEDPEAFAILYDAERAYFAYYLERLTRQGTDPDVRPEKERGDDPSDAVLGPDLDLEEIGRHIGALMHIRASGARDGTISDLAAYDAAAHRHTRGAYLAAARRLTSRPPMGDIAARPVSAALRGDPADGRGQLFTVLDAWAGARKVPAARARVIRQILDDAYVQGMRYGTL